MSQRIWPRVTSPLPEKRRPGPQAARSAVQEWEVRAPAAGAPQSAGQALGWAKMARSLGAGAVRGGLAPAGKSPGSGADLSSSPAPPSGTLVPAIAAVSAAAARVNAPRARRL